MKIVLIFLSFHLLNGDVTLSARKNPGRFGSIAECEQEAARKIDQAGKLETAYVRGMKFVCVDIDKINTVRQP